jgi:serine protease Do
MVENNNALLAAAQAAARVFAHVLVGCAIIAPFAPSRLQAAEVDAIGAPAPIGFADVIERVKPAVVGVRVKVAETSAADDQRRPADPPARKFGAPPPPAEKTPPDSSISLGSGFFVSGDGFVVTNNHVVANGLSVEVTTESGKTYQAKVVGTDPQTDLALLKVSASTEFAFVRFASGLPRVGDWVLAVGNPFGLGGTVTAGIVSARGRDIGAGPYDDYIQIDAPINKGNSGGPAFDIDGNVIGVNTAIYSPSGGSVGIGFDIPAETAKLVVAQLKDSGHVTRGWIGVQIQPVTADIAESLGMKQAQGAIVAEPQAGSPAAKAGVEAGDVITALNGTPVKDSREVARKIGAMAPGSTVKLDILRNGGSKAITVTLGEMPGERQAKAETGVTAPQTGVPHLGLQVAPASEVAGAGDKGVVVTGVEPAGPAAEHGFKTGDVILEVSGKPVAKPTDVRDALVAARQQGKHDVLLRLKSANATRFVALPLG